MSLLLLANQTSSEVFSEASMQLPVLPIIMAVGIGLAVIVGIYSIRNYQASEPEEDTGRKSLEELREEAFEEISEDLPDQRWECSYCGASNSVKEPKCLTCYAPRKAQRRRMVR